MKSKSILLFSVFYIFHYEFVLGENPNSKRYLYSDDLNNIQNNETKVTLKVANLKEDTVIFRFPKITPGIYKNISY